MHLGLCIDEAKKIDINVIKPVVSGTRLVDLDVINISFSGAFINYTLIFLRSFEKGMVLRTLLTSVVSEGNN